MKFMRNDINFFLLTAVFLLVIAVVGITVYYEGNYSKLSTEYFEKTSELEAVAEDLTFHKSELNKTLEKVSEEVETRKEYDKIYTDLKGEKENINQELNSTVDTLEKTKNTLEITEKDLLLKISQVQTLTLNVKIFNTTIENYKKKVSRLDSNVRSLRVVVDEMLNETDADLIHESIVDIDNELDDVESSVNSLEDVD